MIHIYIAILYVQAATLLRTSLIPSYLPIIPKTRACGRYVSQDDADRMDEVNFGITPGPDTTDVDFMVPLIEKSQAMLYGNNWLTCIMCDRRKYALPTHSWQKPKFHTVFVKELPSNMWDVLNHASTDLHPDLIAMYDISSHPSFDGDGVSEIITDDERTALKSVLLSPRGVTCDGKVAVCSSCWRHFMSRHNFIRKSVRWPPKFSIRDGFFIGQLPVNLRMRPLEKLYETTGLRQFIPGSSIGELSLVQPVFQSRNTRILVLRGNEQHRAQGLRGHLQSFKMDIQESLINRCFPCTLDEAPIKVLLTGPCTPSDWERARRVVQIRKQQVGNLIDQYHAWDNQFCRGWVKNTEQLNALPTDGTPGQLFSWNEQTTGEFGPEGSNTTATDDDGSDGFGFVSSTIIDPAKLSVEDCIHDIQQNREDSTFTTIHSSSESEPDWAVDYLPRAFVHLFPFGRGGPDEDRHHKYSLVALISHYLRISTGQFTGPKFVLSTYDIWARQMAQHSACIIARRPSNGVQLAEQWAALTAEELQMCAAYQEQCAMSRIQRRQQPSAPTMDARAFRLGNDFWASMKASCGQMPHSHEGADEARLLCFAYMYKFGKPTLMVTVNPDDTTAILITFLCGRDTGSCPELKISKTLMSQYPGLCATNFDHAMMVFINIIVGWDTTAKKPLKAGGLFGIPKAFFGPAEEQARLSLHCHLLVWIRDHCKLVERLTKWDPDTEEYVINEEAKTNLELYISRVIQSSVPRSHLWTDASQHHIQEQCDIDSNSCTICKTELVPTPRFDSFRKHSNVLHDPALLMCPACPKEPPVAPKESLTEAINTAWAALGLQGPPPTSVDALRAYKWKGLASSMSCPESKESKDSEIVSHPLADPRTSLLLLGLCQQCNGKHRHMKTCSKSRRAFESGYCRSGLCAHPVAKTKVTIRLRSAEVSFSVYRFVCCVINIRMCRM